MRASDFNRTRVRSFADENSDLRVNIDGSLLRCSSGNANSTSSMGGTGASATEQQQQQLQQQLQQQRYLTLAQDRSILAGIAGSLPEIRATSCVSVATAGGSRATLRSFQKSVHATTELRTFERCSALRTVAQGEQVAKLTTAVATLRTTNWGYRSYKSGQTYGMIILLM